MQSISNDAHSNALPEDEIALKQRIQDLKIKLDTIQTEKDESQGYQRFQGKQKWRALVFLIPLLLFTIMPSLLVVLDRFFQVPSVSNFPRENLCRLEFLCKIGLPGYFTWIIFSIYAIGVIIIAFGQSIMGRIESLFQSQDIQLTAIPRAQSVLNRKL